MKISHFFLSENFKFLEENFFIYLNRRVFVMVKLVKVTPKTILLAVSRWPVCGGFSLFFVCGFICGVCFVIIFSSSRLLLVPPDGYAS